MRSTRPVYRRHAPLLSPSQPPTDVQPITIGECFVRRTVSPGLLYPCRGHSIQSSSPNNGGSLGLEAPGFIGRVAASGRMNECFEIMSDAF